jgi:hypothetical protein
MPDGGGPDDELARITRRTKKGLEELISHFQKIDPEVSLYVRHCLTWERTDTGTYVRFRPKATSSWATAA